MAPSRQLAVALVLARRRRLQQGLGLGGQDIQVGGLPQVMEPFQPALHTHTLRLHGIQPPVLLAGDAVHLLAHQPDLLPGVGVREQILPNLHCHYRSAGRWGRGHHSRPMERRSSWAKPTTSA